MFEPVTSIIVKCLDFWRFNEKIHKKMDKTWLYLSAMVRPNGNCFFYKTAVLEGPYWDQFNKKISLFK